MKIINTPQTHTKTSPLGFSLIELCATLVIMVVLVGAITPSLAQIRSDARTAGSTANLMQIGQARDQYAADNKDRIYTYTWRAGESYVMPDGRIRNESTDMGAAQRQNQEIIMRRTGRTGGVDKILSFSSRIPHRRFVHLVLMDYMAGDDDELFPNPVFADPEDGDLLNWQEQPEIYNVPSGIPYAGGEASLGYEDDPGLQQLSVRQRWAFGTSYFSVPYAWQPDGIKGESVYGPIASTPHLYTGSNVDISGRFMNQVLFPSKKVHLFEEFDREQKRLPYFAYAHAKPEKLMFDGSINTQTSGQSNPSVNPHEPASTWRQVYVPLHVFPIPVDGLGSNHELNMRYMWTHQGLQGADYD